MQEISCASIHAKKSNRKLFAWIHAKIKIIDEWELSKQKSDTFPKP